MRARIANIVMGVIILGIGIFCIGSILRFWEFDLFFEGWWTLFLILPGIYSIIAHRFNIFGFLLILVGGVLLLREQGFLENVGVTELILAGGLVIVGVGMIFGRRRKVPPTINGEAAQDGKQFTEFKEAYEIHDDFKVNETAVFWAVRAKNNCQNLMGGTAYAVFGALQLDLSDAKLSRDIEINVNSVFGGVTITAPKSARVEVQSSSAFGGCKNMADRGYLGPTVPKVTFRCSSAFGGIEIQ